MSITSTIGENIKRYRKQNKLTQADLAKQIKKSESSIRKYESGVVNPSWDVLGNIADVFKIELSDLTNKYYSSEDEVDVDTESALMYESAMGMNSMFVDFKKALHYIVQFKAFKNDFDLDFKELTHEEKILLKKEIYRGIQYACFNIKNK